VTEATSGESPVEAPLEDSSEQGREAKRAEKDTTRRRRDRSARGLVIVNTGDGKGKTTASLGVLLRAWGQGLRVIMFQFIKAETGNWGEIKAARKMGIEMVPLGAGFTWTSKDLEHDRALAQRCWQRCREAIESDRYDVVIMDEMTYCFTFGWLDLDDVLSVLRVRPPSQHVIITGRDAPAGLIEYADLVTEMRLIKHPYESGVKAQRGIEF
jgi:cob(I)alamin adenosyltransferase